MYLSILEVSEPTTTEETPSACTQTSENMHMEKILAVEHEIRIGKSFFAKIWQVFATGVGEGGSHGGGAHREGVGEQRRRHRQPPHPLLAPTPRSSFKHSIQ